MAPKEGTKELSAEEQYQVAIRLAKLDTDDIETVANLGYDDMGAVGAMGMMDASADDLIQAGVKAGKVRMLALIGIYVSHGYSLTPNTSPSDVMRKVHKKREKSLNENASTAGSVDGGETAGEEKKEDDAQIGMLRPSLGCLEPYSNDPMDFEEYWAQVESTLNATWAGKYLTGQPDPNKPIEVNRDQTLHHLLASAFLGTDGEAILREAAALHKSSGYHTTSAILKFFRSEEQKNDVQNRIRNQINNLKLDGGTSEDGVFTAAAYINQYRLLKLKLKQSGEPDWDDSKDKDTFLRGICLAPDHPLTPICNDLMITPKETFADSLNKIQRWARCDDSGAASEMKIKARRGFDPSKPSGSGSKGAVPQVPEHVIKAARAASSGASAVGIFLKWRKVLNEENRTITAEELDKGNTGGGGHRKAQGGKDYSKKDSHQKKPQYRKDGTKISRRTEVAPAGILQPSSFKVGIKDADVNDDDGSDCDECDEPPNNDGSTIKPTQDEADGGKTRKRKVTIANESTSTKPSKKKQQKAKPKSKSKGGKANRRTYIARRGIETARARRSPAVEHSLILDNGTDGEVVEQAAVHVMKYHGKVTSMCGAFDRGKELNMDMVSAVTALVKPSGETVLIGIGVAALKTRDQCGESLVNSNYIGHFVDVDERAQSRGGRQSIIFSDKSEVPLEISDHRLAYLSIRKPTEKEVEENLDNIHWIVPQDEETIKKQIDMTISRARLGKLVDKETVEFTWADKLGGCPEDTTEKTLKCTTQYLSAPLQMENRAIPQQQRQKRTHPLQNKRLEGRTCSDTFFSSVKSIRGFIGIQLFVHIASQFLYGAPLRRESESHGAYQDFNRDVGLANELLTDNAQTQTGKKWTATSRKNMTKQTTSAPHSQHQNPAERKVRDVKGRATFVMFRGGAPLPFWCYAVMFVIACWNVTARRKLDWQCPQTLLDGHTTDISHFRYPFFADLWYYEPTRKFPEDPWLPCKFIGFADKCGDKFTYKIWTMPKGDDNFTAGRELTRPIVLPRHKGQKAPCPVTLLESDYSELTFESARQRKKYRTKQNGKSKTVRQRKGKLSGEPGAKRGRTKSKGKQSPEPEENDGWMANVNPDLDLTEADMEPKSAEDDPLQHLETRQGPSPIVRTPTGLLGRRDSTGGKAREPLKRSRKEKEDRFLDLEVDDIIDDDNPATKRLEAEAAAAVYNEFGDDKPKQGIIDIVKHKWKDGAPEFQVLWDTEEKIWYSFNTLKEDHPKLLAQYMVEKKVTRTKRDPKFQWAQHATRSLQRAIRRIARQNDFHLTEDDEIYRTKRRRVRGAKKKKKTDYWKPIFKYGVEVPRNAKHAAQLDEANGNTKWAEADGLEVDSLITLECFEFKPPDYKPGKDYQKTVLHSVYDVKHDLRHKSRLVAGGHLVNVPTHVQIYSSQVKPISVKLLHVIAHKQDLLQLCGDVGNAFVNAYSSELVYAIAGREFGDKEGQVVLVRKALYGLAGSSAAWSAHFSASLRSYGFTPTRYDRDVWIKLADSKDHYEYLCTHVDDFMIVSKEPQIIMDLIEAEYNIKGKGPPDYYLGNDYKKHPNGNWVVGCKKYLCEAIRRVEAEFGPLKKNSIPLVGSDHPEEDTSDFLSDDDHTRYQMLVGMLNWITGIGRFDIAHATTQLARFASCPRKGHLERALRVFGYLKKKPNRRTMIDSRDPLITGGDFEAAEALAAKMREDYPDAAEMVDTDLPPPLVGEIAITAFVDSDHAHDKVTRRSMTGILILLGRTPVYYHSKRQGSVETSTYSAEFMAMRTAVEELISIRYMLRCLGVTVTRASYLFGDNMGVIQSATIKDSLLKKKCVAISYHRTREATAASILLPLKICTKDNWADCFTKSLAAVDFERIISALFYG